MKSIAALLAFGVVVALNAQQPTGPTFKSSVDAVVLDVRVVDESGRFVPDLTPEDFRVVEDGHEQTIASFGVVNLPTRFDPPVAFGGRTVEADTTSNGSLGDATSAVD